MAKHAWVQNPFLMLPSTSSVSTVCLLLLAVTQAAGQGENNLCDVVCIRYFFKNVCFENHALKRIAKL